MSTFIIAALAIAVIILAALAAVVYMRRDSEETPAPAPAPGPSADEVGRRRREAVDRGDVLLDRRVQLDSRRGTLGGNAALDDALQALADRHQRGEISDEQFEMEKTRLLGG